MKSNSYSKFFRNVLLLLVIVFVIDFAIGSVLRHFYFKQSSGMQYRTTYSMEETKADVLIFGSSRASHHYVPDVFESKLNMTYFNVGQDGNYIFYHYALLKTILKRYKPKVIILDILNREFDPTEREAYERIAALLPYYKTHPEIRPIVELKGFSEKLKLLSSIYPFNSSMLTIAIGNTEMNKQRKPNMKGYLPRYKKLTEVGKWEVPPAYVIDTVKLNAFVSFAKDCKDAGVPLYVVYSPTLVPEGFKDLSLRKAKEVTALFGAKFLDFGTDTAFNFKPALFADAIHMNDDGARIMSAMVADSIMNNLSLKK